MDAAANIGTVARGVASPRACSRSQTSLNPHDSNDVGPQSDVAADADAGSRAATATADTGRRADGRRNASRLGLDPGQADELEEGDTEVTEQAKRQQSRAWVLRFDAPISLTRERFVEAFGRSTRVIGRVMLSTKRTERHPEGYRHIHAVIQSRTKSPIKRGTVWTQVYRLLGWNEDEDSGEERPSVYCEKPRHGITPCIDYTIKTEKRNREGDLLESAVDEPWGNCAPEDFHGYSHTAVTADDLRRMVLEEGRTKREILDDPDTAEYIARHGRYLEDLIAQRLENQFRQTERPVRTLYVYGASNTGKSTAVQEWIRRQGYGPLDVFRVASWKRDPFGDYAGEPVLLIDDLRLNASLASCDFQTWLQLLDRFPVRLPARYHDIWAGYRLVAITSNLSPDEQLQAIAAITSNDADHDAFLRRLTCILQVDAKGVLADRTTEFHSAPQPDRRLTPNDISRLWNRHTQVDAWRQDSFDTDGLPDPFAENGTMPKEAKA